MPRRRSRRQGHGRRPRTWRSSLSDFSGIACESDGCVAVGESGSYNDFDTYWRPLAVTWSNGTWSGGVTEPIPLAGSPHTEAAWLNAVSVRRGDPVRCRRGGWRVPKRQRSGPLCPLRNGDHTGQRCDDAGSPGQRRREAASKRCDSLVERADRRRGCPDLDLYGMGHRDRGQRPGQLHRDDYHLHPAGPRQRSAVLRRRHRQQRDGQARRRPSPITSSREPCPARRSMSMHAPRPTG